MEVGRARGEVWLGEELAGEEEGETSQEVK